MPVPITHLFGTSHANIKVYQRHPRQNRQRPVNPHSTSAVGINDRGEVLLQRRSDLDIWTILGGYLDPGEEAGITVLPESIVAALSGSDHFHTYNNGDRVAIINICFRCHPTDYATPRPNDDESVEVCYFPPNELPENTFRFTRRLLPRQLNTAPQLIFSRRRRKPREIQCVPDRYAIR